MAAWRQAAARRVGDRPEIPLPALVAECRSASPEAARALLLLLARVLGIGAGRLRARDLLDDLFELRGQDLRGLTRKDRELIRARAGLDPLPALLLEVWQEVAAYPFPPEACLVNSYSAGANMGSHRDEDEEDTRAPVFEVVHETKCHHVIVDMGFIRAYQDAVAFLRTSELADYMREARAQERRFLVLEERGEVHIRSTSL